jgi:hypothetical protein
MISEGMRVRNIGAMMLYLAAPTWLSVYVSETFPWAPPSLQDQFAVFFFSIAALSLSFIIALGGAVVFVVGVSIGARRGAGWFGGVQLSTLSLANRFNALTRFFAPLALAAITVYASTFTILNLGTTLNLPMPKVSFLPNVDLGSRTVLLTYSLLAAAGVIAVIADAIMKRKAQP